MLLCRDCNQVPLAVISLVFCGKISILFCSSLLACCSRLVREVNESRQTRLARLNLKTYVSVGRLISSVLIFVFPISSLYKPVMNKIYCVVLLAKWFDRDGWKLIEQIIIWSTYSYHSIFLRLAYIACILEIIEIIINVCLSQKFDNKVQIQKLCLNSFFPQKFQTAFFDLNLKNVAIVYFICLQCTLVVKLDHV